MKASLFLFIVLLVSLYMFFNFLVSLKIFSSLFVAAEEVKFSNKKWEKKEGRDSFS